MSLGGGRSCLGALSRTCDGSRAASPFFSNSYPPRAMTFHALGSPADGWRGALMPDSKVPHRRCGSASDFQVAKGLRCLQRTRASLAASRVQVDASLAVIAQSRALLDRVEPQPAPAGGLVRHPEQGSE